MTTTETWTNGRLLTWTTEYLTKHGSSSARLDCEILLAHATGCKRIDLYAAFNEEPSEEVKAAFREMVKRRAEGSPVAYLVGFKEFYSSDFEVNPDVLIPRPETEHLIVEALDRAKEIQTATGNSELVIADVGTGSGAIAVTVAKHVPGARVIASDVSPAAIAVAQRNAERNEVADRIEFLESNLLESFPDQQFDLILSNPPYVSDAEYNELEKTVRDFEPKLALVGGAKGSEIISLLLKQAESRLKPSGFFIGEFSPMLAQQIDQFVTEPWETVRIVKDLSQHARAFTIRVAS